MDADYPAAHSMDTTWFAVDAKGQIGVFHTGEEAMYRTWTRTIGTTACNQR